MDDAALVNVGQAESRLEQDAFDLFLPQTIALLLIEFECILGKILERHARLAGAEILLEVEDFDDVWVFEGFEQIGLLECDVLVGFHDL